MKPLWLGYLGFTSLGNCVMKLYIETGLRAFLLLINFLSSLGEKQVCLVLVTRSLAAVRYHPLFNDVISYVIVACNYPCLRNRTLDS
jgi:hypothetical protein